MGPNLAVLWYSAVYIALAVPLIRPQKVIQVACNDSEPPETSDEPSYTRAIYLTHTTRHIF